MNIKFKNYGLWVALGSLVAMILNDFYGIAEDVTGQYVDIVLTILIAAGVISNPEGEKKGFNIKEGK